MPQRLKDDERRLMSLIAAGETPEVAIALATICPRRGRFLLRRWEWLGWYYRREGELSRRGLAVAARHGMTLDADDTELDTPDDTHDPIQ